jgi:hypothetical protein
VYIVFSVSLLGLFLLIINAILFTAKIAGKDKNYRTITAYLITLSILETICNFYGILHPNENLFLSHFAFNSQFLILSYFFYNLFTNLYLKRIVIITFVAVWLILIIQYCLYPALFWKINLFETLTISSILITYALIHLYNILGKEKKYFYFTIGLFMYLLSTCIIFISGNLELVFCEDPLIDIWIFNSLFYIIYQVFVYKEWKLLTAKK